MEGSPVIFHESLDISTCLDQGSDVFWFPISGGNMQRCSPFVFLGFHISTCLNQRFYSLFSLPQCGRDVQRCPTFDTFCIWVSTRFAQNPYRVRVAMFGNYVAKSATTL